MLLVKASRPRPKDGDTKPATGKQGGTLVFSKGRWRRKESPSGNLRPKGGLKIVEDDVSPKLKPKARQGKQWGAAKPSAPVEQASQLRFTRWGQKADGAGAGDDDEEITSEWLDASDKMLAESLAKFGDPLKRAFMEPPMTFEDALNNIVPTDPRDRDVVKELKADLLDLQRMARDFAIEKRLRVGRGGPKGDDIAPDDIAKVTEALNPQIETLNRIYKGKVTMTEAKSLAVSTRAFHAIHPRKMIRVPKGTTQREYSDILDRLFNGDKQAMKQYTVPRPSKKSKKKKQK
jgi:hypothetical protein